MKRNGLYYLNNTGSRWVVFENGVRISNTWTTKSGKEVTRRVLFFESWGNFGCAYISYKGKRISVLSDTILED
jgi:hypothetical protein